MMLARDVAPAPTRPTEIEMNKLSRLYDSSTFRTSNHKFRGAKFALALSGFSLLACSSVSEVTEQRVARSETVVRQAQQSNGQSEEGAVQLQKATTTLAAAKTALAAKKNPEAERLAQRAELEAELSVAQVERARASRGAAEVSQGLETLRQEAARP
jgi:Domain of unknown function (DUF4398)